MAESEPIIQRVSYETLSKRLIEAQVHRAAAAARIAELEGVQKVLVEEAKERGRRIAELEGENERLAAANKYANTFGYRRAIDDVLAVLEDHSDLLLDCYCHWSIADKVEALRGGGE